MLLEAAPVDDTIQFLHRSRNVWEMMISFVSIINVSHARVHLRVRLKWRKYNLQQNVQINHVC